MSDLNNNVDWISIWGPILVPAIIALIVSFFGWVVASIRFQERVKTLESKVKTLEDDLKQTRDKTIACETRLEERSGRGLVKSKSPVSLTEKGLDLLQKSGGQEWIISNRIELIAAIKEKKPTSAYDVQEFSKIVLKEIVEKNDPRLKPLKDYAYAKGIPFDDIVLVMSIQLRDESMPEFPEYKVQDIPNEK